MWARRRLVAAQGVEAKQRAYFEVVQQLSVLIDRRCKPERITAHDLRAEPCGEHLSLHWLVAEQIKPSTVLAWRTLRGSERMRPTMVTTEVFLWEKGDTRCVGRTLLFADHYYLDHVELVQLSEASKSDTTQIRYLVRSRFDFLHSWMARRFKGKIREAMSNEARELLTRWTERCLRVGPVGLKSK